MKIVDALCTYNYNVSRGKVDGEILYTIDVPCDPCGTGTREIWRTPVYVHKGGLELRACYSQPSEPFIYWELKSYRSTFNDISLCKKNSEHRKRNTIFLRPAVKRFLVCFTLCHKCWEAQKEVRRNTGGIWLPFVNSTPVKNN